MTFELTRADVLMTYQENIILLVELILDIIWPLPAPFKNSCIIIYGLTYSLRSHVSKRRHNAIIAYWFFRCISRRDMTEISHSKRTDRTYYSYAELAHTFEAPTRTSER